MQRHQWGLASLVAGMLALAMTPSASQAQIAGGANGVLVDAQGVVHRQSIPDPTGQVARDRIQAARASLDRKVATPSKLRKVSLTRLEAVIRNCNAKNLPITDEMKFLAGLNQLKYVFYYPETKDLVIAGPAEGWVTDAVGHTVGIESNRATLELQDMIVALRAYPPSGQKAPVLLLSIDPTPEGLASLNKFLREVTPNPNDGDSYAESMRQQMGSCNVVIKGMPANTHFAQVMLEADYRMKLIGFGLEKPGVKMTTYVDRASAVSSNALSPLVPDAGISIGAGFGR